MVPTRNSFAVDATQGAGPTAIAVCRSAVHRLAPIVEPESPQSMHPRKVAIIGAGFAGLGLKDRLRWQSPVMGMFCEGRIWRFMSLMDLLWFRRLSFPAKLRFGFVMLFIQNFRNGKVFERVTAADWLRRYAGRELWDTIWGPMLRSKFGARAETISMAWVWNKMQLRGNSRNRAGNKESLGHLAGGFGQIFEALTREIHRSGGT